MEVAGQATFVDGVIGDAAQISSGNGFGVISGDFAPSDDTGRSIYRQVVCGRLYDR